MAQSLIPGGVYVNETGTRQALLPGGPLIFEAFASGPATYNVSVAETAAIADTAGTLSTYNETVAETAAASDSQSSSVPYEGTGAFTYQVPGAAYVFGFAGDGQTAGDSFYFTVDEGDIYYASSDVSVSGWTRFPAGGSLASATNEATRDDDTGIISPPITATGVPARFGWNKDMPAGTHDVVIAAGGSSGADKQLTLKAYDSGGGLLDTVTELVDTTLSEHTLTITIADESTEFSVEFSTP